MGDKLHTFSLEELKNLIKEELPQIGEKLYSMQIINFSLLLIKYQFGQEELNDTIEELDLDLEGWEDFIDRDTKDKRPPKEKIEFLTDSINDFLEMN